MGAGLDRHALAVLVSIDLDNAVESFLERQTVCRKADDGKHDVRAFAGLIVAADLKDFGRISGVDVVTRGGSRVAGNDCKILPSNA